MVTAVNEEWPGATAQRVLTWAAALRPSAGPRRVVAFEGRSGSGKTTLARAVAAALNAPLLHMDDLYAGWDGLRDGVTALHERVLVPLAENRPAVWRRWDWTSGAYAEEHRVPDGDWLLVEGVGSGGRVLRTYLSGIVWIEASDTDRKSRALARDGQTYAPHWERWARQEDAYYDADQVREAADLIVGDTDTAGHPSGV
jgi:cytidylate kinase